MKNQSRIIVISLIGLIVSAGLFLFVVRPTIEKVADLNTQASAKKTDLKQLQEQIVIYKNSQRDLSLASGKDLIADSLLAREDLQLAIEEIEQADSITDTQESMTIADDGGKTVKNAIQLVSGKSLLVEVPFNIHTTSDFPHFVNFMQYLEQLPHFDEVSAFTLQSSAGSPDLNGIFVHNEVVIGSIDAVFFVQK